MLLNGPVYLPQQRELAGQTGKYAGAVWERWDCGCFKCLRYLFLELHCLI